MLDGNQALLDLLPACDYDFNFDLGLLGGGDVAPQGQELGDGWDLSLSGVTSTTTATGGAPDVEVASSGDSSIGTATGTPTLGLIDDLSVSDMANMGISMGSNPPFDMPDNFLLSQYLTTNFTMETPLVQSQSQPHLQPPQTTSSTPRTTTSKSPSSIPGTSTFSLHPSPTSSTQSSQKRKATPEEEETSIAIKRQRNTVAARKYRQKRLDRIAELESALEAMTNDRDDIRLKLARKEAEVDALREMLHKK